MQSIRVLAFIEEVPVGLLEALRAQNFKYNTVRKTSAWVTLREDRSLSVAYKPELWATKPGANGLILHLPGASPSTIYPIPEVIKDLWTRCTLEGEEIGDASDRCQVVSSSRGERLYPYRIEGGSRQFGLHRVAHFTGASLGIVKRSAIDQDLAITILDYGYKEDTVVVHRKSLIDKFHADNVTAPSLPAGLGLWQLAVRALYERMKCPGCARAHYSAGSS